MGFIQYTWYNNSFGAQLIPTDESTPTNDVSTSVTPLAVAATQSASLSTQNLPTRASDIQNSNQHSWN